MNTPHIHPFLRIKDKTTPKKTRAANYCMAGFSGFKPLAQRKLPRSQFLDRLVAIQTSSQGSSRTRTKPFFTLQVFAQKISSFERNFQIAHRLSPIKRELICGLNGCGICG